MIEGVEFREIGQNERPYVLDSWRESHHEVIKPFPWSIYKREYGVLFAKIVVDGNALTLGAYRGDEMLGYIVVTRSKRIDTVHWVYTRWKDNAGVSLRRHGLMNALLDAAELGEKFIYTLRGRSKLMKSLVTAIQCRGQTPVYVSLLEWVK